MCFIAAQDEVDEEEPMSNHNVRLCATGVQLLAKMTSLTTLTFQVRLTIP